MEGVKLYVFGTLLTTGFAFPQRDQPNDDPIQPWSNGNEWTGPADQPSDNPIQPWNSILRQSGTCASIPSFFNKADRIVGGKDAPSNIPWQVSIRQGLKSELSNANGVWLGRGNHWCGGTILDSWTVLSAAHCFFEAKNFAGQVGKGREYVKDIQPYIKVGSINNVAEEAEAQKWKR